tara:strand:- start:847 stop:1665 length:819 start_codon:yes stop_codon:yes gene_type:complete
MPVTNPRQADLEAERRRVAPNTDAGRVASYYGINIPQRQAAARSNTPAIASSYTNGAGQQVQGNSGNTGNTGNTGNNIPAPTTQTQQRAAVGPYQDSTYNAQISSIERALADYETGATTRGQRYGIDYNTGLQKLGYRPQEGFNPIDIGAIFDPATAGAGQAATEDVGVQGAFDIEGQYDPYSAAAQGTRSRRDDFASRGMLRSSDFTKNFGEFQQRLNEQLGAMETGRTRFVDDMSTEVAQQRTSAEERRQSARRDAENRAIMRAIQESGF